MTALERNNANRNSAPSLTFVQGYDVAVLFSAVQTVARQQASFPGFQTIQKENLSGTAIAMEFGQEIGVRSSRQGVLPLMNGGPASQETRPLRTFPECVLCLVSVGLFLSSVASMNSPYPAWAAVHQCLDAAGKTVLTNRPSQLHNCHVLSEETASTPAPPTPITTPQVSSPPISSDIPPAPPYAAPAPPNLPDDAQGSSIGSLPPPHPGASLSPTPPQPCSRGLNPFNPLSAPPCARSDESGTNPPEAASGPTQ